MVRSPGMLPGVLPCVVAGTTPDIVAHLIVGSRPEPYLAAVLDSIAGVCDHAVINDNSGRAKSANSDVIASSALARSGRLTLLRTEFRDFSTARNQCLDATPARYRDGWVLFVDADEVHGDELPGMASLLATLPNDVDAVDGYSRHFVGSFAWWRTIERRLCFFRYSSSRRWTGAVHEQLAGVAKRVVIPAVWFHYGHVVPPRREWEKSRLYASLGQKGWTPDETQLASPSPACVWGALLRQVLPYGDLHPAPVRATIDALANSWRSTFEQVDAIVAHRSAIDRMLACVRAANFSRLIGWRSLEARLRWNWTGVSAQAQTEQEVRLVSFARRSMSITARWPRVDTPENAVSGR